MTLKIKTALTTLTCVIGLSASLSNARADNFNIGNFKPPVNPMTQPPFAGQGDVVFGTDNKAALKIAEEAYVSTLDAQKSADETGELQVALVNLTNNNTASIAVKFNFPNTCKGSKCFTTILRDVNGSWRQVFAQAASSLTIGAASKDQLNAILVDHTYVWENYNNTYLPLLEGYVQGGKNGLHIPNVTATPDLNNLMNKLIANAPNGYNYAYFQDGALGNLYAVQIAGVDDGSDGDGLPRSFFIYSPKYGLILKSTSHGLFGVSNSLSHDNVSDILIETDLGIEDWQYSAKDHKFSEVQTSYVSPISPVPGLNE